MEDVGTAFEECTSSVHQSIPGTSIITHNESKILTFSAIGIAYDMFLVKVSEKSK